MSDESPHKDRSAAPGEGPADSGASVPSPAPPGDDAPGDPSEPRSRGRSPAATLRRAWRARKARIRTGSSTEKPSIPQATADRPSQSHGTSPNGTPPPAPATRAPRPDDADDTERDTPADEDATESTGAAKNTAAPASDRTPSDNDATENTGAAKNAVGPASDDTRSDDAGDAGRDSDDKAAESTGSAKNATGAGARGARSGEDAGGGERDASAEGDAAESAKNTPGAGARGARSEDAADGPAEDDAAGSAKGAVGAGDVEDGTGSRAVAVAGGKVPAGDVPDPVHDIEQRKREAGVNRLFPFGRPGEPLGRAHPFVFGFTGALGVITAWLLVKAATNAQSVLVMILVAMFLAVGLNPAVERLKRLGLSRGWAVAVVFLGVLLFVAGFLASLIPPLTEQVTDLTKNVPDYIQQLRGNRRIAEWDQRYHLLQQAQDKINDSKFQQDLAKRAYDVGKMALSGTFQTLTVLILTLYFLGSLPQIKSFAYQLAPRSRRARVALLGDEILDRIGGYVAGQFTIAFIAGVTSYIFLEILGVPYALALALIVAVTDLIPLVGATIGASIVCLVAFLTGTYEGIAAVIFYIVYQQVENYLVYPRVMKRTVDVQPAVTIVAALIGGTLLGVVGALLAIPTAAAISLLIREIVFPRQERL